MDRNLLLRILLFLSLCIPAGPLADCAAAPDQAVLAIMRPDVATILEWQQKTRHTPQAFIDPVIRQDLQYRLDNRLGSSFSLKDRLTYDPEDRYQGDCGNCWNWAAQGVAGIALQTQTGIADRLSVQFLDSCKLDRYACCGGWLSDFAEWYSQKGMFLPWNNVGAEYGDSLSQCSDGASDWRCSDIETTNHYGIETITVQRIPTHGISRQEAIANIKNILNQNKAVWFGFFLPDQQSWDGFTASWQNGEESTLYSLDSSCGRAYTGGGGGHAVLLVGYNDEVEEPYWEIINSWGTAGEKRPNGMFRIPMDMDYDCVYQTDDGLLDAFSFQTLDIVFSNGKPSCSYAISPPSAVLGPDGGDGTLDVITTSECTWSATTDASWITITSGANGVGNGTVSYRVEPNAGDERTGSISIGNRSFSLYQQPDSTSSQLLKNPGFELGNNGDWYEDPVNNIISAHPCYGGTDTLCPQQGTYLARLGGANNTISALHQNIVVPDKYETLLLSFWYRIVSDEQSSKPYDYLTVTVTRLRDNFTRTLLTLDNTESTDDWVHSATFDLSEFIGSSVKIQFAGTTDASFPTRFYLDTVRLTGITGKQTIPLPPQSVSASDGTYEDHILVGWESSAGASYYQLFRCLSETVINCSLISTTALRSHEDYLTLEEPVYYRVKACNSVGCSDYSPADSGFLGVQSGSVPVPFPWNLYLPIITGMQDH